MKYLALVYVDQKQILALPRSELNAMTAEVASYFEESRKKGEIISVQALHPAQTAATVRKRNGKVLVTDGPFAETKEQLAGFALLEANDLNDAIHIASSFPGARYGSVEVRAVAEGFQDIERFDVEPHDLKGK